LARIATTYYFLHFIIILPLLGFFEKTDPIPLSISEPVLTGGMSSVMAKSEKKFNDK
jgi:ubiquinol-cytochrome c reductase cytochrome b subunit